MLHSQISRGNKQCILSLRKLSLDMTNAHGIIKLTFLTVKQLHSDNLCNIVIVNAEYIFFIFNRVVSGH